MQIFKTNNQLKQWNKKKGNESIGFIPTMGSLHQGHLSLIKRAKKECDKIVVSIFVNKLQFSDGEDFNKYPRTLNTDIEFLQKEKVNVLYIPSTNDIYPKKPSFQINELNISQYLEGVSRPDFFSGVIMVVLKLFNLVEPSHVYFGEKDIQQMSVIKNMIEELNFPIKMNSCKTVRESNGLAMSSRNQYLSVKEKDDASIIYKTLKEGERLIKENSSINYIKKNIIDKLTYHNMKVDYVSIANIKTFQELTNLNINSDIVISIAVWYKSVRLIDNLIIYKK